MNLGFVIAIFIILFHYYNHLFQFILLHFTFNILIFFKLKNLFFYYLKLLFFKTKHFHLVINLSYK